MTKQNETSAPAANQKRNIRKRYQGISQELISKIPAAPQKNFFEDDRPLRIAVYVRVSTDDPRQTSSYELQKNHYLSVIKQHPAWTLIQIYADEGISGTSLARRTAFLQMIDDCREGKIDLILVKSVARFARNIVDCLSYSRRLAALSPPVGVFFEAENLSTLSSDGEMRLSFFAAMAQEESRSKSEIMNTSIEMRFGIGIFLTPTLLGYDHDGEGNLIINEEEAKTVRLIFFMYLYGYSCQKIADTLTKLRRKTKNGNTVWSPGSVLNILQNERHCGDVLARKTFTPNYLNHKAKKNRKDRNQYRQNGHHEPIVSRDDFIAVQKLISNAKYGYKGFFPSLHTATEGMLKGFVTVHPRWASFLAEDYRRASLSGIRADAHTPSKSPFHPGSFDLRKFEVARAQFFHNAGRLAVTFSPRKISFTLACTQTFDTCFIKLLVHPAAGLLAAVPAKEEEKCAVRWLSPHKKGFLPKKIPGTAFLPNLYDLFAWNPDYNYRILGFKKQNGIETALIFDSNEAETLIPHFSDEHQNSGGQKFFSAYPKDWAGSFGSNYYCHDSLEKHIACESAGASDWNVPEGTNFKTGGRTAMPDLQVTNPAIITQTIEELMKHMKQEAQDEHKSIR